MKEMQFITHIKASKQKVWQILWSEKTFRQWASVIDPGTYMVGELKKDNEIQFISAENGYGVTSLVADVRPGEYLLLKHQADTQDSGEQERKNEWTGGQESYTLTEDAGTTTLTLICDVPTEMEENFSVSYPEALEMIKSIAEAT